MKSTSMRITFYFFGLLVKSFGLSFIILSNMGTGAWEALYVGLLRNIGLSVGFWLISIGTTLLLVNAYLLKKNPSFLSILTVFLLGFFLDLWLCFLDPLIVDRVKQTTIFWIGLLFASMGVSIYVQAKFALTPIDQFMYAISKRTGLNLMFSKTIGEVIAFILALVVHGPIGLGTIIFTVLFGPLIQFFIKRVDRMLLLR